jgi:hypothetical protein
MYQESNFQSNIPNQSDDIDIILNGCVYDEIYYENGDVYIGYVDSNNRHMRFRGEMKYSCGNIYDGHWENNMKTGKGIMRYLGGDCYNGDWKNDKMNGKGLMKYQNGDSYIGDWYNNNKHGKGLYTCYGNNKLGVWIKNPNKFIFIYLTGTISGIWNHDICNQVINF